ncbi:MAG: NF038122 family metalloprotease [Acidobacteria bacterium]|nr:NF038122 family metalloprotease [Acidobacteriota bacterium]
MKNRLIRVSVSSTILAMLFCFLLAPSKRAQSSERQVEISPDQIQRIGANGYVVKRTGEGSDCRVMTESEAAALMKTRQQIELHPLSADSTNQVQQQQGLKIILRGTSQLDSAANAKQSFLRAAARWEAIIQTPITVVIDVDFGTTFFGQPYEADTLGSTVPQLLGISNQYGLVRNVMISKAADARQAEVLTALPTTILNTDLGATASMAANSPILRALGFLAATADPDGEVQQIGEPPAIGFNSAFSYDFDSSDGIEPGKLDFEAISSHEIGHALGFSSFVGFKELSPTLPILPTVWDFFRFRPGNLALSSITSEKRLQLTGGDQVYFVGDSALGLSTGGPDNSGGDGQQASHWKDDGLTGQFVGIMDPNAGQGLREFATAADLLALSYFGYRINPGASIIELLSVDDGSREEVVALSGAMVVNRLSPSRFPSTLQAVRVQLPLNADGSSAVGQQMRIVAFVDPNRTGQPPANPSLIVDRTITIPALGALRFTEIIIPTPPTISAGDLYVGVQSASASVSVGGDRNGRQQRRSFISTNNGASFQPFVGANNAPLNFIVRAELGSTYNTTPTAIPSAVSPSAVAPGSAAFTLTVQGDNFRTNSVVKWNGSDRQTMFFNGNQLTAQIMAADVASAGTARVTVSNPGGGESEAIVFTITANNPVPVIARLTPDTAATGTQPVTIRVIGTDFNSQSVVRLNGQNRTTAFVNSTQLEVTIPASDLSPIGLKPLTVANPAPGGGISNEANLSVISCSYSLSRTSHTISSTGVTTSNLLTTNGACSWTAVPNSPWITMTNPASGNGAGKYVLNYQIAANADSAGRTGAISIAGQSVSIRQLGKASSVSAASFAAGLAPNSIGAIFGAGLAKGVQSATTTPLPTNLDGTTVTVLDGAGVVRAAPLFFVAPGQINFLVPATAVPGTSLVSVLVDGVSIADGVGNIGSVAPGLFTANANGRGLAAAVLLRIKANGTQSYEAISRFDSVQNAFVPVPIDFGDDTDKLFLLLYGTGISGRSDLSAVTVLIGAETAAVSYAGPQGDYIGLDQVNVELPRSLKGKGEQTITMIVDLRVANAVTASFK